MSQTLRLVVSIAALAVAVLAAVLIYSLATREQGPVSVTEGRALIGGPFALVDTAGKPVADTDFRGRYMLIFFGFANCPDVCPTALQKMADALATLGPEDAAKLVPIFITIDPERDTAEKIRDYVTYFDPRFVGLTGSAEQVAAAAKAYRVYVSKVPLENSALGYTVDHSSFIYLMGPDGAFVDMFGGDQTGEELAAGIKRHLASN